MVFTTPLSGLAVLPPLPPQTLPGKPLTLGSLPRSSYREAGNLTQDRWQGDAWAPLATRQVLRIPDHMDRVFCLHRILHNLLLLRDQPLKTKPGRDGLSFPPAAAVFCRFLKEQLACRVQGGGVGLWLGPGDVRRTGVASGCPGGLCPRETYHLSAAGGTQSPREQCRTLAREFVYEKARGSLRNGGVSVV